MLLAGDGVPDEVAWAAARGVGEGEVVEEDAAVAALDDVAMAAVVADVRAEGGGRGRRDEEVQLAVGRVVEDAEHGGPWAVERARGSGRRPAGEARYIGSARTRRQALQMAEARTKRAGSSGGRGGGGCPGENRRLPGAAPCFGRRRQRRVRVDGRVAEPRN